MPKKLPRIALSWAMVLVVIGLVGVSNRASVVLAAEVVRSAFFAVPFKENNILNQVRLGATYLVRPDIARRAAVVWGYTLTDEKVQRALSDKPAGNSLYFKPVGGDEFTVLSHQASQLCINYAGSVQDLLKRMKELGVEVGVALGDPAWKDLTPMRALINWKGWSANAVFLKDKSTATKAISELLDEGFPIERVTELMVNKR